MTGDFNSPKLNKEQRHKVNSTLIRLKSFSKKHNDKFALFKEHLDKQFDSIGVVEFLKSKILKNVVLSTSFGLLYGRYKTKEISKVEFKLCDGFPYGMCMVVSKIESIGCVKKFVYKFREEREAVNG